VQCVQQTRRPDGRGWTCRAEQQPSTIHHLPDWHGSAEGLPGHACLVCSARNTRNACNARDCVPQ
jgi:hypothetical protein